MCQNSEFSTGLSRGCVEKAGGLDLSCNVTSGRIVPRRIARLERSSRRCGTVSRREIPRDCESGE